jgi:hypothetical protein
MPAPVAIDRSNLNAISQRMMQERVDPNKAREDARNMALLQAGLAIAGGTSPHFAQNLAGAIPALQDYQTQVASIRREGRDELKAQFDSAKADVEAQYQQGTLTYHERSIAMERINNQERNQTTLQAHRLSAGVSAQNAAEARADRALAREDRRETANQTLAQRREEAGNRQLAGLTTVLNGDPLLRSLAEQMTKTMVPEQATRIQTQYNNRYNQVRQQYMTTIGNTTGQGQPDPLGIR